MNRELWFNGGRGSKCWSALALLCYSAVLGGCQTAEKPAPEITTFAPVAVPKAQPINTRPVEWKVYNTAQLEALVADLKKSGKKDYVIFALTPKGYENLSYNLVELERYIKEQKEITLFLKKTLDSRSTPPKS